MGEGTDNRQRVARDGFSNAHASEQGQVHVDFWLEGTTAFDDPLRLSMSPGQALVLIQRLADAAQRALKGVVNG